jgi:hypothetical protein
MHQKVVEKIVERLKSLPFVNAIVLFGSHSLGKASQLSDIDICVVDGTEYTKAADEVFRYSTDEIEISLFSKLPLYIRYEVLKGHPVWIRDKEYFYALKEKTVLEYLDTQHIWNHFFRNRRGKWVLRR